MTATGGMLVTNIAWHIVSSISAASSSQHQRQLSAAALAIISSISSIGEYPGKGMTAKIMASEAANEEQHGMWKPASPRWRKTS